MQYKNLIIFLMLGIILYLFVQKAPKIENINPTKYITKYEQKIDTIFQSITKIKTIKKPIYDTIILYKDSIIEARQNKDTIRLVIFQDSVIKKQDIYIKYQDTLINKSDSIISLQNKEKDFLKETIKKMEKEAEKQKKRNKIGSFIAGAGMFLILILK